MTAPRIYNLFWRLAGRAGDWTPHIERARAMGFSVLYTNPIQPCGFSGSLYSIRDFLAVDERIGTPDDLARVLAEARAMGLSPMADFVAGHSAIDAPLVAAHPEWYRLRADGEPERPGAWDGGHWVEWGDLARFDHERGSETGLWDFLESVGRFLLDLGYRGFRCDAAYQIPDAFWRRFIPAMRAYARERAYGEIVFFAENLGCPLEDSIRTGKAGFDWLSSSAMWWEEETARGMPQEDWLSRETEALRPIARLVAFPETHDTERAFARALSRAGGDETKAKGIFEGILRFAASYADGWLVPIGCEYGFRKRLDCVRTTPADWEEVSHDATALVAALNRGGEK